MFCSQHAAFGRGVNSNLLPEILASIILGIKNSKKLSMKTCFYVQAWLMIVTGVCSILLIKISPYGFYALYLALCFLSGYFSTFVNVPLTAQFQLMVDEEYQTRFFSTGPQNPKGDLVLLQVVDIL